jgi:membrane protease YdiL (CAAX protease family)
MIRLSDSQRARLRWIFTGSDGIRAGWSVAIFLGIIMAASSLMNLGLHLAHHKPHEDSGEVAPVFILLAEAALIALVLGATAVMRRIEKRSIWSYGLSGPNKLTNFLVGLVGGFVSLSVVVGALYAGGYLAFDGLALHGVSIAGYALVWLLAFFMVGVAEETIFRGYLLTTLTRGMGFWPGATLLSVLFAVAHISNKGENVLGILQVFIAGMVLCLMLRVTGSLWMSIGFHTTWDWAQSYFYGTPDSAKLMKGHLLLTHAAGSPFFSGGTAGPEGSVFAPLGMVIGPLVLVWLCQRTGLAVAPVFHRAPPVSAAPRIA